MTNQITPEEVERLHTIYEDRRERADQARREWEKAMHDLNLWKIEAWRPDVAKTLRDAIELAQLCGYDGQAGRHPAIVRSGLPQTAQRLESELRNFAMQMGAVIPELKRVTGVVE